MAKKYNYDYTKSFITTKKQALIDLYLLHNFTDSYSRGKVSIAITAHNKANKDNPLKLWEIVKLYYPSYFSHLISDGVHPQAIIENKFTKNLENIFNVSTAQVSNWQKHEYLFNPNTLLTYYYHAGKSLKCKFTNSCYVLVPSTGSRYYPYDLRCDTTNMIISAQDFNPALFQEF